MALRFKPSDWIWMAAYLAVIAAVTGGLWHARQRAFVVYGTDKAQSEWDAWREDAENREGGPVKRRVPKSAEPPALVLMRDYFGVCLLIALSLSSVLFATFVFLVRGAMSGSATFIDRSPPEPPS